MVFKGAVHSVYPVETLSSESAHMVAKMRDEDMKVILLDFTAEEKQDATPWNSRPPLAMDGDDSMEVTGLVRDPFLALVEASCTLVATATAT